MLKSLVFGECDHEGDLDAYEWEVVNNCGCMAGRQFDPVRRIGILEIRIVDEAEWKAFRKRFKQTTSSRFLRDEGQGG